MAKVVETTELDLEQLGKLVAEGYTSGRLDCDDGKHITWSIKIDAWEDEN